MGIICKFYQGNSLRIEAGEKLALENAAGSSTEPICSEVEYGRLVEYEGNCFLLSCSCLGICLVSSVSLLDDEDICGSKYEFEPMKMGKNFESQKEFRFLLYAPAEIHMKT